MAKYRKTALVDAEVFKPGMEDGAVVGYPPPDAPNAQAWYLSGNPHDTPIFPYINTLEGRHFIGHGDYILTGIQGERWPCKKDIFEATYELAEVEKGI